MLLKRFYDENLAQASYLVGCEATGEAVVVDPHRDADQYVAAAAHEEVRITHVTETHIHADFVSGSRELAERTGAALLLSDEGGEDWRYGFAGEDGAELLRDGALIRVGDVTLQVMHTPGHTPEHLSFLVTDGSATSEPIGLLSGDFIFVGDVGRPDLLEKAAGAAGTMEAGARQLYRSLRRVDALPDHLQLWPGHGAGSACGKALGAMPSSTLGYERLVGWAFSYDDEDAFVEAVLADQPEPPRYFATMKAMNRDGPPVLGRLPEPARLGADRLPALLRANGGAGEAAVVLDLRPRDAYAAGHARGALHLPFNRSFTRWAGWLVPYDRSVYLIAGSEGQAHEAARALALIGVDRVEGYFGPEAFERDGGRSDAALEEAPFVDPREARRLQDAGALLVDVRSAAEWQAGHPEGAHHLHLGALPEHVDELPADGVTLFFCRSGARSAIAQGLALARGRPALNVTDGLIGWTRAGLPVDR
jgi:hydroxyacylglutathione hydrolase